MDLYALPPEEFTAARNEQVKAARAAGDKALATRLAALRRPTASAYAVNALVRAEPELLAQLAELGVALGQAQGGGDGARLRGLGEQRRQLLEAVADRAAGGVGGPLSASVRREVTGTLEAALADPASADAVRSGRLVRALSYAGFGAADLDGAVAEPATAVPDPAPARAGHGSVGRRSRVGADAAGERSARIGRERTEAVAAETRRNRLAAAEQAAQSAAGELDDAVQAARRAADAHDAAVRRREQAAADVRAAETGLRVARDSRDDAQEQATRADRAAGRAQQAVDTAQRSAEQARAALDRLRR